MLVARPRPPAVRADLSPVTIARYGPGNEVPIGVNDRPQARSRAEYYSKFRVRVVFSVIDPTTDDVRFRPRLSTLVDPDPDDLSQWTAGALIVMGFAAGTLGPTPWLTGTIPAGTLWLALAPRIANSPTVAVATVELLRECDCLGPRGRLC